MVEDMLGKLIWTDVFWVVLWLGEESPGDGRELEESSRGEGQRSWRLWHRSAESEWWDSSRSVENKQVWEVWGGQGCGGLWRLAVHFCNLSGESQEASFI